MLVHRMLRGTLFLVAMDTTFRAPKDDHQQHRTDNTTLPQLTHSWLVCEIHPTTIVHPCDVMLLDRLWFHNPPRLCLATIKDRSDHWRAE